MSGLIYNIILILLGLALLETCIAAIDPHQIIADENHWYVLISASKFFFNYRHTANVIQIYLMLKKYGVTDERILLFLPDNYACNPRNPLPGTIIFDYSRDNCYFDNIEVDYRDYDVSSHTILNLLRGRHEPTTPINKRLLSDSNSKIMIYISSHGGDNFIKIQDTDIIQSEDFAAAFSEMHIKKRYKEIVMITDTCRAMSIYDKIEVPNMLMIASADRFENAHSKMTYLEYHLVLNDVFSYFFVNQLKSTFDKKPNVTIMEIMKKVQPDNIQSGAHIVHKSTFPPNRDINKIKMSEYFGESINRQYEITSYTDRDLDMYIL